MPPVYPMPERIDAPPEVITEAVLRAKPKDYWRYAQAAQEKRRRRRNGE